MELEGATYNYYLHTVDELKAPFIREESVIYQEGPRLISIKSRKKTMSVSGGFTEVWPARLLLY